MNTQELLKYIDQPELLDSQTLSELEQVLKDYPYFATAHMLYLKNLKNISDPGFDDQLPYSAIHVYDRSLLYELLFVEKEIIKQDVDANDVDEIVNENIEQEESVKIVSSDDDIIILDPQKVRRKIKDGLENMGLNISETIASQLDLSILKDDDELEIIPETYFKEDELDGIKRKKKKNDITEDSIRNNDSVLSLDEADGAIIIDVDKASVEVNKIEETHIASEIFELDDELNRSDEAPEKKQNNRYFDINQYKESDDFLFSGDLISKFIKENPMLDRANLKSDNSAENVDISQMSALENDDLASETLAKLYISQGYLDKALDAYKKLSLKYPEKNTYFASQIEKINELISKHKNI